VDSAVPERSASTHGVDLRVPNPARRRKKIDVHLRPIATAKPALSTPRVDSAVPERSASTHGVDQRVPKPPRRRKKIDVHPRPIATTKPALSTPRVDNAVHPRRYSPGYECQRCLRIWL